MHISNLGSGFINYEQANNNTTSKLRKRQQKPKQCCLDIASRQVTIGPPSSLIRKKVYYNEKIIIKAAENGDTNWLKDFLTKNPPCRINQAYYFAQKKYTLLHIALISNQFNTVKYLVEKGASLEIYPNLFVTACQVGSSKDADRSDIVHYLLSQGVKLPEDCEYIINSCVFNKKINTFKTLVDHGIKPTFSTDLHDIHRYFNSDNIEYLRYLLENNLKVDTKYNGLQLIHIACISFNAPFSPSIEIIKLLLEYGANINAQSESGNATPLHFLLANSYLPKFFPVLQFLVQNGAKESLLGKIKFDNKIKYKLSEHARKIIDKRNNKYKAIDLVPAEDKISVQEIIQHHRQEYLNNKSPKKNKVGDLKNQPTNKQSLVSRLKVKFKAPSAAPLKYLATVPSASPFEDLDTKPSALSLEYRATVSSAPPFEYLDTKPSAPPFEDLDPLPSAPPFESLENVVSLPRYSLEPDLKEIIFRQYMKGALTPPPTYEELVNTELNHK